MIFNPFNFFTAPSSGTKVQHMTPSEAALVLEESADHVLLDVRTHAEYDAGHIPGALNLPVETLESTASDQIPDKEKPLLIYCLSGGRARVAAQKLAQMGYTDVREFGGIMSWRGPIVTNAQDAQR